jgi:hypothetical protein
VAGPQKAHKLEACIKKMPLNGGVHTMDVVHVDKVWNIFEHNINRAQSDRSLQRQQRLPGP